MTTTSRTLPKNAKAVAGAKAKDKRVKYTIKGERGLVLVVHPTGRRTWFAAYQLGKGKNRKRHTVEIGDAQFVTLDQACDKVRKIIATVEAGDDPNAAKTFGELFAVWLDEHAKKKLATWGDEERRYHMHLAKALGDEPFAKIERRDVAAIRDEVEEKAGPIQSNRVVALFNRVANFAVDEGLAKFNPANRLRKLGQEQRRERILSPDELARLWAELDRPIDVNWGKTRDGEKYEDGEDRAKGGITATDLAANQATRRAIKLLILTAQRRGEVIGMTKDELDLTEGDAWWAIPAKRTKNGLPHRVPLTHMAVEVVKEAIEASGSSKYVFPSQRTKEAIAPDAVTKALQRICRRMTPKIEGLGPHDLRRTFGTMARKLGVSVEDRGYVLNHVSGAKSKVTSWNYDAGEHDDEKRAALEKWERELRRIVGLGVSNVVPLRA